MKSTDVERRSKDLKNLQTQKQSTNFSIKSFFIKTICMNFDFIPTLLKENSSLPRKIMHTLVGFFLYVSLLLVPAASYYSQNTKKVFSLVFLDQNYSICALARNTLTVYLMLSNIVETFILPTKKAVPLKQKQAQSYHRGFRNLMIMVGIFIARTYQLFMFDIPSKTVFSLGHANIPLEKYGFLGLYYLQSLIVSLLTIILDDYLSIFCIVNTNKLVLYQIGELLISVLYMDPLINYSRMFLIGGPILIFIIKIISDSICTFSFTVEHSNVKGYSRKHQIKGSSLILSATYMHAVLKKMLYNFLATLVNPALKYLINPRTIRLLNYLQKYQIVLSPTWYTFLTQLELGEKVLNNPLINEQALNLTSLLYLPLWAGPTFNYIVKWGFVETFIIKPIFIYFVSSYTPELKADNVTKKLTDAHCKIKGLMNTPIAMTMNLEKGFKRLTLKSLLLYLLTEPIIILTPVYGLSLKGYEVAHMYNMITTITSALRETPNTELEALPDPLCSVIKYSIK